MLNKTKSVLQSGQRQTGPHSADHPPQGVQPHATAAPQSTPARSIAPAALAYSGAGQSSRSLGRTSLHQEHITAERTSRTARPSNAPGATAAGGAQPHRLTTVPIADNTLPTSLIAPPHVLDCDRGQRHQRMIGPTAQPPRYADRTQTTSAPMPTTCHGQRAGASPPPPGGPARHGAESTFSHGKSHGGHVLRLPRGASQGAATPSRRVRQVGTRAHTPAPLRSRRLPPHQWGQRKSSQPTHRRQTTQQPNSHQMPCGCQAGGRRPRSQGCARTTTG